MVFWRRCRARTAIRYLGRRAAKGAQLHGIRRLGQQESDGFARGGVCALANSRQLVKLLQFLCWDRP